MTSSFSDIYNDDGFFAAVAAAATTNREDSQYTDQLLDESTGSGFGRGTLQPSYDDSLTLHEKRKAETQKHSQDVKTIKQNVNSTAHEHSNFVEKEEKREAKKPGRKLDTSEPASKRKAQNRAAQRAFRERKEKHMKDMEDRVHELEQEAAATNNENEFLKKQVDRLQTELKKYRGSTSSSLADSEAPPARPFTFEFPFFDSGKRKQSSGASTSSSSAPRRSVESEVSPNFSSYSHGSQTSSPFTSLSEASNTPQSGASTCKTNCGGSNDDEEDTFCDQLQLACGCEEDPVPMVSDANIGLKPIKQEPEDEFVPPLQQQQQSSQQQQQQHQKPEIATGVLNNKQESSLFSPPPLDFDFLGSYRDPMFEESDFQLPELATTEYSVFDPLENPIVNESYNSMGDLVKNNNETEETGNGDNAGQDEEVVGTSQKKMMSCTAVWDRISTHPKFNDMDIDGLCAELRSKAKCSDNGVLITEKDVDKVLNHL